MKLCSYIEENIWAFSIEEMRSSMKRKYISREEECGGRKKSIYEESCDPLGLNLMSDKNMANWRGNVKRAAC
jgi:hypothetical protein